MLYQLYSAAEQAVAAMGPFGYQPNLGAPIVFTIGESGVSAAKNRSEEGQRQGQGPSLATTWLGTCLWGVEECWQGGGKSAEQGAEKREEISD